MAGAPDGIQLEPLLIRLPKTALSKLGMQRNFFLLGSFGQTISTT